MKAHRRPLAAGLLCAAVAAGAGACSGASGRTLASPTADSAPAVNQVADCAAGVHGSVLELLMVYDQTLPSFSPLNENSGYTSWFADVQKMPAPMRTIAVNIGTNNTQPVASGSTTALQEAQDLEPQIGQACEQAYTSPAPSASASSAFPWVDPLGVSQLRALGVTWSRATSVSVCVAGGVDASTLTAMGAESDAAFQSQVSSYGTDPKATLQAYERTYVQALDAQGVDRAAALVVGHVSDLCNTLANSDPGQ